MGKNKMSVVSTKEWKLKLMKDVYMCIKYSIPRGEEKKYTNYFINI